MVALAFGNFGRASSPVSLPKAAKLAWLQQRAGTPVLHSATGERRPLHCKTGVLARHVQTPETGVLGRHSQSGCDRGLENPEEYPVGFH
jgi:hypothetical protein